MVMSLIESLTRIKNAVYGREVREAIHDGVFRANQIADGADAKADNTQIRQDAVEDFNAQVIQEMTDKDVISAPEIIEARGGKPTLQARLDETTAQLVKTIEKTDRTQTAFHFGIKPNTTITKEKIQAYFDWCIENEVSAKFEGGTYTIRGENIQLPHFGLEGLGRNETILLIEPINDSKTNVGLIHGVKEGWTTIKGDIKNIHIRVPERSLLSVLEIRTPSRNYVLDSVILTTGYGACVNLDNTFYIDFKNVLFTGYFRSGVPSTPFNAFQGIGLQTVGTGVKEVNNLTFSKCDFKYLSNVFISSASLFDGSNTISYNDSSFETIGDLLFLTQGFKQNFNSCYFENLDQNRNVVERPNYSTIIFMQGGGGQTLFTNCLLNLSGIRETGVVLFRYLIGSIIFTGGSVTGLKDQTILELGTYSSRGQLVNNGTSGLTNLPAYMGITQQNTSIYPSSKNNNMFTGLMADDSHGKNTLFTQSLPTTPRYTHQPVQPIIAVEGRTNDSTHLVESHVTLYRYLRDTKQLSTKELVCRFVVSPDMPEYVTVDVYEKSKSANQVGFSDSELLTKIKARRKTPLRTNMTSAYAWHYQLFIHNETNGSDLFIPYCQTKTSIILLEEGTDGKKLTYGIYPVNHDFGTL